MDLRERPHLNESHIDRHPWELARVEVISKIIMNFMPQLKPIKNNILDIGCGDCFLVEQLSRRLPLSNFYEVDTSFDMEAIETYSSKAGYSNIHIFDTLDKAFIEIQEEVSIVLLLDVLEHIDDDVLFLEKLKNCRFITDNTFFLITVPAFQFLFSTHDVFLGHFRRYNSQTLKRSIEAAGYKTVCMGYFFSSLLAPRFIQSIFYKFSKNRRSRVRGEGIGNWKRNRFRDTSIKKFLIADFKIAFFLQKMGIKLPGLSNYMICKKYV